MGSPENHSLVSRCDPRVFDECIKAVASQPLPMACRPSCVREVTGMEKTDGSEGDGNHIRDWGELNQQE
jgi:hypothetical protein